MILSGALLLIPFQNCGQAKHFEETSASSLSDGRALYSQYCVSCHGQIEVSTKLGYTSAQIATALATQPLMAPLAPILSSEQIDAIAAVLANP